MNLFGVMDISGSALHAERVRAEITAANMANAETTRTADGGPYQRKTVSLTSADGSDFASNLFSNASFAPRLLRSTPASETPAGGVDVTAVNIQQNATVRRYDPSHPDADKDGYVEYPDINPLTEMVDLMGESRAYGLNTTAVQAEKSMLTASLDLLK